MQDYSFSIAECAARISAGQAVIADILCRDALAKDPSKADAWAMLARVATAIGERDAAARYLAEATRLDPALTVDRLPEQGLAPPAPTPAQGEGEKFHLIKAWGNGFTSDIDHTLGHLLLAEVTGRTPVIHWGRNSLFGRSPDEDAFREFFLAVSGATVHDLARPDADYFPPKWNAANLLEEDNNKLDGSWSRLSGLSFFNRPERVTVGDYHVGVATLVPWIRPGHALHGAPVEAAFRYLARKYLRLRPEIQAEIDAFEAARFTARPVIAVHVRGSDKHKEDPQLGKKIAVVPQAIQQLARNSWYHSVFLLTDSEPVLREFQRLYPANLITTDCTRTDTLVGLHYQKLPDRVRLGVEVIRDVWLAARCDSLVGNGSSNVTCLAYHLKDWPRDSTLLLGPPMTQLPNLYLYLSRDEMRRYMAAQQPRSP